MPQQGFRGRQYSGYNHGVERGGDDGGDDDSRLLGAGAYPRHDFQGFTRPTNSVTTAATNKRQQKEDYKSLQDKRNEEQAAYLAEISQQRYTQLDFKNELFGAGGRPCEKVPEMVPMFNFSERINPQTLASYLAPDGEPGEASQKDTEANAKELGGPSSTSQAAVARSDDNPANPESRDGHSKPVYSKVWGTAQK